MVNCESLTQYTNELLNASAFKDYCPNGLQVQGCQEIGTIISGVSANLALIEQAISHKADAIFVHHGLFWTNEKSTITGAKRHKIALLLEHNINLFGYHLPLDAHTELGNNAQLAKHLNIERAHSVGNDYLWQGQLAQPTPAEVFSNYVSTQLNRPAQCFAPADKIIETIAWCTGAAQQLLDDAIDLSVDAYLSGEVSERTPHSAIENNMAYIAAGHHATERYGVQALCAHLSERFNVRHRFIDIDNPV